MKRHFERCAIEALASCWAVLAVPVSARAGEPDEAVYSDLAPTGENPDGWRFSVAPYFFVPVLLSGTAAVGEHSTHIDADLGDMLSNLNFVGGVRGEFWYEMFGVIADAAYVSMGDEAEIGQLPADYASRMFVGDLLLGVRALRWRFGRELDAPTLAIEVDGGLRVTAIRSELRISADIEESSPAPLQGVVGLNVPVQITRNLVIRADGTVAAPDWNGSVTGHVELVFAPFFVDLGYRYTHFRYVAEDLDVNLDGHGPHFAVGARWGEASFYP